MAILIRNWRTGGEMVANEVDAVYLDLGPFEDLDHDLGIAGIAPFEQGDRRHVVTLLDIEALNLGDRQPGASGVRAVAGLQVCCILDLLQANGLPAPKLDFRQKRHLPYHEDQGPLTALGRRLIKVVANIREPLGTHQGFQVGLDAVLIERLTHAAQELGLDLVGGDRGVPLKLDLGDQSFGKPAGLCPSRSWLDDQGEDGGDARQTDHPECWSEPRRAGFHPRWTGTCGRVHRGDTHRRIDDCRRRLSRLDY